MGGNHFFYDLITYPGGVHFFYGGGEGYLKNTSEGRFLKRELTQTNKKYGTKNPRVTFSKQPQHEGANAHAISEGDN